jgi:hypothetical protein
MRKITQVDYAFLAKRLGTTEAQVRKIVEAWMAQPTTHPGSIKEFASAWTQSTR